MGEPTLPRHIVDRFERRWAQKLEAQAKAWKVVQTSARSVTNEGVVVVRRRNRAKRMKELAA
jgi:hypothetical protein